MINRKQFLQQVGGTAAAMTVAPFLNIEKTKDISSKLQRFFGSSAEIAKNEDFWHTVQQVFTVDRSLINLNNGGVSPAPGMVQSAMRQHLDSMNDALVYTMWKVLEPQKEAFRQRIAWNFGVKPEEIAITRNASEGLQICQFGFDLNEG